MLDLQEMKSKQNKGDNMSNKYKFIELGSDESYNYKDYKEVKVKLFETNHQYSPINFPYSVGEIIEAGWINQKNRKYIGVITKICASPLYGEDERCFEVSIKRIVK